MPDEREAERERFVELRRTNDPSLRQQLVEDHLWLARHATRRFTGRGEPSDDLLQVASLGLVHAVDRFDPEHNVRFSTFAMPTIVGELRRHFRDRTWSMRVSRRLKDLHLELKAASEQLAHDLGRSPTVDELADALDCTPEDVLEALPQRDRRVVYLRFYLGMTQSEIAEEVGVSQVHVSRILRAALAQLGEDLDERLLDPDA